MTITIYTSKNCQPCKEVERLIQEGRIGHELEDEIELVDIETDEGFAKFTEEVLQHQDGQIPSAYREGKKCAIGFDEENNLVISCSTDNPPSSGQG